MITGAHWRIGRKKGDRKVWEGLGEGTGEGGMGEALVSFFLFVCLCSAFHVVPNLLVRPAFVCIRGVYWSR